ncbi:MAG: hypothetical protein HC780_15330, partial [Leptolyngbyaceae cyanobacterium CSU_1_3]|nr:hypothetical protein [Leptolyngbyaceae cyanobacterium CSU_1_3]
MGSRSWKRLQRSVFKFLVVSVAVWVLLHPVWATIGVLATTPPSEVKPAPEATSPPQSPTPETAPDSPSTEPKKKPAELIVPVKTPAEIERQKKLAEGDRLYLSGDKAAAEALYRAAKPPFSGSPESRAVQEAIVDPAQLSPGGQVYWRESGLGLEQKIGKSDFRLSQVAHRKPIPISISWLLCAY